MRRITYLLLSATLISGCAGVSTNESVSVLLEKSAASSPKLTPYQKGKQYLQLKLYGLAVAAFQQELQENPDSVRSLNGLAIAYDQLGRQDVSQALLDRALKVDPDSAVTLSNLAYLNLTQGNTAVALAYSERAKVAVGAATDMPLPRAIAEAVARNNMIAKDVAANDADAMLPEIIENLPTEDSNVKRVGLNEWELHLPGAAQQAGSETVHKTVQAPPQVITPTLVTPAVESAPPVVQDAPTESRSDAEPNVVASESTPSPAGPAVDAAPAPSDASGPAPQSIASATAADASRPDSAPSPIPAEGTGPSRATPTTIPVEAPSEMPIVASTALSPVAMPEPEVASLGNEMKEMPQPRILAPAALPADPAPPSPAVSPEARVVTPVVVGAPATAAQESVQVASALPAATPARNEDRNQAPPQGGRAAAPDPLVAATVGDAGQWSLQLPSGTRVRVSNGAGRRLMATRFSHYLGEHGLAVRRIANAASFNYKASIVFYNPEQKDFACELASRLPFPVKLVEAKQGKGWIEVVLGSDLLPFDAKLRASGAL